MTVPKECKMSDLSYLTKNKLVSSFVLSSLFSGADRGLDKKFIIYRKIFIRLIDKSIYEYLLVRDDVINQINAKNGEIYMFSAVNHLENCINTVRRLFYLFDHIKSDKNIPFTIDKTLRKLIYSYSKIIKIRDFVQHIDEHIQKGSIIDDQPIALEINENASKACIGKYELSLSDLYKIITKFYEIGYELARYNARNVDKDSFKVIREK